MRAFWNTMLCGCRFTLVKDYEGHHTFTPEGIVSGDVRLRLEPLTSQVAKGHGRIARTLHRSFFERLCVRPQPYCVR